MISTPVDASVAPRFHVHAYPLVLRILRFVLQVVLVVSTLYASALIFFFTFTGAMDPRPPARAGWLFLLSVGLFGLLRLLDWLTSAMLFVEPERLVLERRGDRFEIPLASVESVRVWWLFPPGMGLSPRMQSGRAFRYGLRMADPLPVLEALGREDSRASAAARHPNTAFAHARALVRRRWYLWVLKFVLFPLLPGGAMFYTHQMITYGGPYGQYQWYGLGPYLRTFSTYWLFSTAVLVLCAFLLRAVAELVAFVGAWISPSHARAVRRFVEISCTVLYYVGFPAIMAWQYLG
ncbi:MAG TPA: hypothetical protein VF794_39935 [Archangium sp.]|jgi:hypothetical protein|uniref:hypothetical protein n=1 Tax=Archangium sp. TaxID=1872627 RepID=UPI002ED93BF4